MIDKKTSQLTPIDHNNLSMETIVPVVKNLADYIVTLAELKTFINPTREDLSIENVDNTADIDKPISNAVQEELDVLQPLNSNLSEIAALSPAVGDILFHNGSAWTKKTVAEYTQELFGVRSGFVEIFDDLIVPTMTNTYVNSVVGWRSGHSVDFCNISGNTQYGSVGMPIALNTTTLTRIFVADASYNSSLFTTDGSPGFTFIANTVAKFRVIRTIRSTGTETQYWGFLQSWATLSSASVTAPYGMYFYVTDSGNLHTVTKNASGTEDQDTGITFAASSYKTLEIRMNAAGTQVLFYVDGVLKTTHTTYFFANTMRGGMGLVKSGASATTGSIFMDYFHFFQPRT